jgi:hypothetical protein
MKPRSATLWLCALTLIGVVAGIPIISIRADTGPKPSMNFTFIFEISPALDISSGTLIECNDAACSKGESLQQLGPQYFDCTASSCSSLAYSYSEYQRLVLEFSDGVTRSSNVFTKSKFAADYVVNVFADRLEVVELSGGVTWPITGNTLLDLMIGSGYFCLNSIILVILVVLLVNVGKSGAAFKSIPGWYIAAWVLAIPSILVSLLLTRGLVPTLITELTLGLIYTVWRKHPKLFFLTIVLLLNIVTQPALWLTVSGLSGRYPVLVVLFAEMVVWVVEAVVIFLALRRRIGFGEALLVSLVLNAASFGIGLVLPL